MPHAIWSIKDIVVEILSRLSTADLARLKCTSKYWENVICDPLFLRVHHQKSQIRVLGYLAQRFISTYCPSFDTRYICVNDRRIWYNYESFCQNKLVLMSISHGIICSRKFRPTPKRDVLEFDIYIVCLVDSTCITIKGDPFLDDDTFAFVFEPFGCSFSTISPCFKVANIYRKSENDDLYRFSTYSSETGRWMVSTEICRCSYSIQKFRSAFVNGCFHWLGHNRYIIAFNPRGGRPCVIELPDYTAEYEEQPWRCDGQRIGEFDQGYLHYASISDLEVRIWILVDYFEPKWIIKYRFDIVSMFKDLRPYLNDLTVWEDLCAGISPWRVRLLCFTNDLLVMQVSQSNPFLTYNFREGKVQGLYDLTIQTVHRTVPTFLPHSLSLAAIQAFKELCKGIDSPSALLSDTSHPRKIARHAYSSESVVQQLDHRSSQIRTKWKKLDVRPLRKCKSIYRTR